MGFGKLTNYKSYVATNSYVCTLISCTGYVCTYSYLFASLGYITDLLYKILLTLWIVDNFPQVVSIIHS